MKTTRAPNNLPPEIVSVKAIKPNLFRGNDEKRIRRIPNESLDVVILNTRFELLTKEGVSPAEPYALTENSRFLLEESARALKAGGLLFVYGLPKDLPFLGEFLSQHRCESGQMIFKYWIALDIDVRARKETVQPAHMGLLFYLKSNDQFSEVQGVIVLEKHRVTVFNEQREFDGFVFYLGNNNT